MLTSVCQRWRDQRGTYRPAGETFDPARHEVALIPDDTTAKRFVLQHHYAATYPAARFRFGLYRSSTLVGVAVVSQPCRDAVLACLPGDGLERAELGRFVLLDEVRANGESWFLARAFELLRREELIGLVMFSDPTPRTDAMNRTVFRGHVGTIYQATNAVYLGRAKAEALRLLPDGSVLHNRAVAKIRSRDKGHRAAVAALVRHGARPLLEDEDPKDYLAEVLPCVVRRTAHPGNHKYAMPLTPAARRHLRGKGKDYPKWIAA